MDYRFAVSFIYPSPLHPALSLSGSIAFLTGNGPIAAAPHHRLSLQASRASQFRFPHEICHQPPESSNPTSSREALSIYRFLRDKHRPQFLPDYSPARLGESPLSSWLIPSLSPKRSLPLFRPRHFFPPTLHQTFFSSFRIACAPTHTHTSLFLKTRIENKDPSCYSSSPPPPTFPPYQPFAS